MDSNSIYLASICNELFQSEMNRQIFVGTKNPKVKLIWLKKKISQVYLTCWSLALLIWKMYSCLLWLKLQNYCFCLFMVADLALAMVAAVLLVLGHLPWSDNSVSQHIDLVVWCCTISPFSILAFPLETVSKVVTMFSCWICLLWWKIF